MGRYRKGIIAVLTALLAVASQLLSMGLLDQQVAQWVTIVVALVGAVLTVLVPNEPQKPPAVG